MSQNHFTNREMDRFNDKISNVLDDLSVRPILRAFLKNYPVKLKAFILWEKANESTSYDNNTFDELIDDTDDFNMDPLNLISEDDDILVYIKQECCRILQPIHRIFIPYLDKLKQSNH